MMIDVQLLLEKYKENSIVSKGEYNKVKIYDTLVIVDVQENFKKFMPRFYLDALFEYCEYFKNVYQIWDNIDISEPSYTFPNQKGAYSKSYGIIDDKFIEKIISENDDIKEGDLFKHDYLKYYVVKVDNNHEWFFINDELQKLFNKLKGKTVILVGGAKDECIEDVYVAMKSFGIIPIYDWTYIYSARTNEKENFNYKINHELI